MRHPLRELPEARVDEARKPLDVEDMAGHLIRRLHQNSTAVFQTQAKALGVDLTPVQFAALSAIAAEPGIDQATVAARIAYDRATIGGVIDRLDQKGLVARGINPQDRRARVLALTEDGARLYAAFLPQVRAFQDAILPGLSAEERTTFLALAAKAGRAGD